MDTVRRRQIWDLLYDPENNQIDICVERSVMGGRSHWVIFRRLGTAGIEKYALKNIADGIEFPTLTVHTRYADDKLGSLDMLMIDSAEFNEPVDEKEFALAAKAGTHVFIYRNNDPSHTTAVCFASQRRARFGRLSIGEGRLE